MVHDLTPDDLRKLDDDALANLARWRREEWHRLRGRAEDAEFALGEAEAERARRRETNRGACPTTPEEGNA